MSPDTVCHEASPDTGTLAAGGAGIDAVVRPRRVDVVVSYDLGAERYERLWSPVILPSAVALVRWLGLADNSVVLDVGGGTGALGPAIRGAAPSGSVFAVDASVEMLRIGRRERAVPGVQADALALPVPGGSVDAVLLAYVLFHLTDPLVALMEARRVLRPGGRAGTVTWACDKPEQAQLIWNEMLEAAGVPPLPLRSVYTGLDSPDAVEALFQRAGLVPERKWTEHLSCQWDAESFFGLVSGSGQNRQRLAALDPDASARLLADFRVRLDGLGPEGLRWQGEVVCAIAAKPASARDDR